MRWLLSIACALGMVAPSTADGVVLRLQPKPGTTYNYVQVLAQDTNLSMGAMGEQRSKTATTMELRLTVKEPDANGNVVSELECRRVVLDIDTGGETMRYDSADEQADPAANPLGILERTLVGRTLEQTVTPQGAVIDVKGLEGVWAAALKDSSEDEDPTIGPLLDSLRESFGADAIRAMLQQVGVLFPDRAVTVGESWSKEVFIEGAPLGPMRTKIDYTLTGREGDGDDRRAVIAFDGRISLEGESGLIEQIRDAFRQQGVEIDIRYELKGSDSSGRIAVEEATGLVTTLALESTMTFDVAFGMGGEAMDMTMVVGQTLELRRVE